jgi:dimethylamine corrinoid protein
MIDLQALTEVIGELDEDRLLSMINEFVATNPSQEEGQLVVDACQKGMAKVGDLFESGEYFVGDLIFAGELLTESIDILKPVIGKGKSEKIGKIVVGTVEGDLHDVGKNIFRSMAEAAGFEVYDLGIDQKPAAFIEKAKEVNAGIIGLSGILTIALKSMKNIVDQINEAGLRKNVKIIIGGNPVTAEACRQIGADAFTNNAAEGIRICQSWVKAQGMR